MLDELLEGENEEPESEDEVTEPSDRPTATLDQLKGKKRVTKTIPFAVTDEDGGVTHVSLTFRGIPAQRYDKLIAKCPPRPQDKKQGYQYNPDKFGPELVAACCIEPEMTVDDVTEIWQSDNWNRGERMTLLMTAIEVCTAGLSVPTKRSAFG